MFHAKKGTACAEFSLSVVRPEEMGISPSGLYSAFVLPHGPVLTGCHFIRPSVSRKPHVDIRLGAEFSKRRSYQFYEQER